MIKSSLIKEKGLGLTQEKNENYKMFMHDASIYISSLHLC